MSSLKDRFEQMKNPLPKAGDVIDGFTIDNVIGQGSGMITYKAASPDQEVAFKILRPKFAGSPAARDMVAMETDVLRTVTHPGVPRFIADGIHGVLPYIVQSLGGGRDLEDLFLNITDYRFPSRMIRAILRVCEALEALHERGIIHRDIKPENILVDTNVNDTVTLVDFGGCQFKGRGEGKDEAIGRVCGTLELMPPEVANKEEAVPATDTYSVMALVRYIVYGTFPIGHRTTRHEEFLSLIKAGTRNPPPPIEIDTARGVPTGFREILEQGTAYEVEKRFQSAQALADALRPFAQ